MKFSFRGYGTKRRRLQMRCLSSDDLKEREEMLSPGS
jgi:hypothetical protein